MADNSTDLYGDSDWNLTKGELTAFFVTLVIILVSGMAGNILSIVILSKGNRCSRAGFSTYFQLLAVSDLTVLLLLITMEVMINQSKFHQSYSAYYVNLLMHKSEILCKFLNFCWYFCPQLSTWITVALTTERTLSISFPILFYRTNSSKRAYIVSGAIFLASLALNAPITMLYTRVPDYQNDTATNNTYKFCSSHPDLLMPEYISSVYLTFAIPFLILTFCNIILLVKLCKNRRFDNSGNTRRQSIRNVTYLVFGVSVLHCLAAPVMAYNYTPFEWLRLEYIENNWYSFDLLATVCYSLNSSVNWVLYSLIGKDFREDVKDLLRKYTKCCAKLYDKRERGQETPIQIGTLRTTEQSGKPNHCSSELGGKR